MTNDKTKIANLFLGNTKKYSKYRLFDEPVATKIVEISSGPDSEAILKTKEDDKQEYTMDVINDDAVSTGSVIVSKLVKRACKKYTVNSLFGLPRAVILAIYQNCKLTGTNVTNEITMDHLVAMIGNNKSCIKTTIHPENGLVPYFLYNSKVFLACSSLFGKSFFICLISGSIFFIRIWLFIDFLVRGDNANLIRRVTIIIAKPTSPKVTLFIINIRIL
jgi:hypothetical protein